MACLHLIHSFAGRFGIHFLLNKRCYCPILRTFNVHTPNPTEVLISETERSVNAGLNRFMAEKKMCQFCNIIVAS